MSHHLPTNSSPQAYFGSTEEEPADPSRRDLLIECCVAVVSAVAGFVVFRSFGPHGGAPDDQTPQYGAGGNARSAVDKDASGGREQVAASIAMTSGKRLG